MTADVDLDTLTRLAQAATPGPWHGDDSEGDVWAPGNRERICRTYSAAYHRDAAYLSAVSPDVVLALVERVRAAETAIERVRGVLRDPNHRWWHTGGTQCSPLYAIRDALNGPAVSVSTQVDPESTDDPNGPQNAASEGDA